MRKSFQNISEMWKLFIVLPILCSNCFPSVPQINAKVDIAFQTKKLQKCILDTTSHYAAQRVKPSDRLPFSSSQIQQLCMATSGQRTQTSDPTSTPQPTTSLSPITSTVFVQPPTVTLDTSVSATLTTMQETTMSTATAPVSATLSTPMHETTVSTTTTPTVSNTVVFGPARRPTMSSVDIKQEKTKLIKELNTLQIFLQILTGLSG